MARVIPFSGGPAVGVILKSVKSAYQMAFGRSYHLYLAAVERWLDGRLKLHGAMKSFMAREDGGPPEHLSREGFENVQPGHPAGSASIKDREIFKEVLTRYRFRYIIGRR